MSDLLVMCSEWQVCLKLETRSQPEACSRSFWIAVHGGCGRRPQHRQQLHCRATAVCSRRQFNCRGCNNQLGGGPGSRDESSCRAVSKCWAVENREGVARRIQSKRVMRVGTLCSGSDAVLWVVRGLVQAVDGDHGKVVQVLGRCEIACCMNESLATLLALANFEIVVPAACCAQVLACESDRPAEAGMDPRDA